MEVARELELGGKTNALAVVEETHGERGWWVRERVVDSLMDIQAHSGVNGNSYATAGEDFIRLHVESLAQLVWRCLARSAFTHDVGGYLNWRAVGEGTQAQISNGVRISQLDMKRSYEEECCQGQD